MQERRAAGAEEGVRAAAIPTVRGDPVRAPAHTREPMRAPCVAQRKYPGASTDTCNGWLNAIGLAPAHWPAQRADDELVSLERQLENSRLQERIIAIEARVRVMEVE